jgi:hypothetical protein
MAGYAVVPRLERMLAPARPFRRAGYGFALAVLLVLMALTPAVITALAS